MQRCEPQSDIIEFRGKDGSFQQGTLVDCAPGGLMIDWECQGEPAPHFVPFGQMYLHRQRCLYEQDTKELQPGKEVSVEVLLRRNPKEPRTWYPGMLLYTGEFNSAILFGSVNVSLPDGATTIALPKDRIRPSKTDKELEMLLAKKVHFVKKTVRLPATFSYGKASAQEMLDALNRRIIEAIRRSRTFIKAIMMDDRSLHYITNGKIQNEMWEQLLSEAVRDYSFEQNQRKKRKPFASLLQPLANKETDPELFLTTASSIRSLSVDIMVCIFEQFDSVDQVRFRRVCAYWNCILTSPCITSVLRVHYKDKKQNSSSVTSLHQGWTSHTKIILNADVDAGQYPLFCGGRFFETLVRKGLHSPVETLIIANAVWTGETGRCFTELVSRLVEELNALKAACQKLVLYDVQVNVRKGGWPPGAKFIFPTVRLTGSLTVEEFWSWMDDSLESLDDKQTTQLSDWIVATGQWRQYDQPEIVNVLNDRQSSDPRKDVQYRGRNWTEADVATLELHKLSKLTLHSLVALRNGAAIRISFSS